MDKVYIFDTTLRDGEQSPGASMTLNEKIRIATALEKMQVDIIEAGFAIASEGDFQSVKAVADTVKESQVCSLSRANEQDIQRSADALKNATQPRIHTFIATSPIHMEFKLRMEPEAVLEQAIQAVKFARKFTDNVEFSPEDAGRSDIDFLCRIIEQTIAAGATTINIPDTVGYTFPKEFGNIFKQVIERVPNSHKAIFSAHCHNDLGLAVANSMAAVENGARQIECTINGLGERAGNTALEEVVMAIRTRQDFTQKQTQIDATQLVPTSRLVAGITGFPVQPNKAIVGANAFAHESGIHQAGVLKSRETYEIMNAEDVGWQSNRLVLGKHSGRAALKDRLQQLGYAIESDERLQTIFQNFKDLADRKHEIYDDDLQALISHVEATEMTEQNLYQLISLKVVTGTDEKPQAQAIVRVGGIEKQGEAIGDGAVDATFKAIESIIQSGVKLLLYSVTNVTDGTDAQGEVSIRIEANGAVVNGQAYDTDIINASAKAYINALNRINDVGKLHPQKESV
jgi:2-isopropylmalate synthase